MPQKRFHKITWEGEGWLFNTIIKGDNLLKIRSLGLTCSPFFSLSLHAQDDFSIMKICG